MPWPVDSGGGGGGGGRGGGGGGGGRSDSMVMWFQGLRQRNQPREPARPRGQSNDVRLRDQSTGPWSGLIAVRIQLYFRGY